MSLTNTEIKNFKPAAKAVDHADAGGLYLRVYPSGTKTFMYRSRVGGKARWTTVGEYPSLSLADARKRAMDLATGQLPSHITVRSAYDEWLRQIKRTYKSPDQVVYRMEKHLLGALSTERLTSITRAKLSAHLTKIAETAPVQANRVLTDFKLLFSYAVERGWLEVSPAEKITQRVVGGKEKTRDRVLEDADITVLLEILITNWNANTKKFAKFDEATRFALAIALLTGQRSNEVRSITKAQVVGRTWTIPRAITKTDEEMRVYMPYLTSRVVRAAFSKLGKEPFKDMEGQTLSHATRYMKFAVRTTPHDLRRTMRTRMADLGVAPHVGEKCLNHKLSGVLQIYDRAEYAAEKKQAWRLWARYLLGKRKAPLARG